MATKPSAGIAPERMICKPHSLAMEGTRRCKKEKRCGSTSLDRIRLSLASTFQVLFGSSLCCGAWLSAWSLRLSTSIVGLCLLSLQIAVAPAQSPQLASTGNCLLTFSFVIMFLALAFNASLSPRVTDPSLPGISLRVGPASAQVPYPHEGLGQAICRHCVWPAGMMLLNFAEASNSMCAGHLGRLSGPVLSIHQAFDDPSVQSSELRLLRLLSPV